MHTLGLVGLWQPGQGLMRAIAIIGIAAIAGAVAVSVPTKPAKSQAPYQTGQPAPPQEDRELDCRNPQDALLCREYERQQAIRGGRLPALTGAYRPPAAQAPTQYGVPKPSFNCARAATVIEQAICSDATLAQWDARMGQLYRQALAIQNNNPTLVADQNRWRAQRNRNCSGTNLSETKSCVLAMTKARVGGLGAVVAASGGNPNSSPPTAAPIPYSSSSQNLPTRPTISVEQQARNPVAAEAELRSPATPAACVPNAGQWTPKQIKACENAVGQEPAACVRQIELQNSHQQTSESFRACMDAKEQQKRLQSQFGRLFAQERAAELSEGIRRAEADPSPALLEYEAEMMKATHNVNGARAAQMCHLRSDAWLKVIGEGYLMFRGNEAKRLNLSAAEIAAADKKIETVATPQIITWGPDNVCEKMVNSPLMDQLDEIERKLTGNYH
jgi:Lysozyme inhibitor LprI